jgi:RNA polymerase sigma factor (sigma-70 family)
VSLAEPSVHTSSGRVLTLLYKEHAADAFRYALHLTGRRADAEDIVQHVFLQAHRHLESGRELVSPRAWLLTAVKHRAFNLTRDRREVPVDRPVMPVESHETSGDEAAQLAEVRGMLWTLPEAQHHAFVLRHWSGLAQSEIADVLETTPTAVESLLGRARSALLRAHDASDACSQVRHRLLESTELGAADLAHLGACRPCRHARDRLARAANLAGTLALVPGAHVAHAIAGLAPGFSAHAATSTAAAIGSAGGAGAGAGSAGASLGTTTAVTTAGKAAVIAKAAIAVAAATAAVGAVPAAHHSLAALIASDPPRAGSTAAHHANRVVEEHGPAPVDAGSPAPATAPPETGPGGGKAHRPAENPGRHGGTGKGLGTPAAPGAGKPAGVGVGPGNGNGAGGNGKAVGKPDGVGAGNSNAGGKPVGTGNGIGSTGGNGNAGGNGNGKPPDPGHGKPT